MHANPCLPVSQATSAMRHHHAPSWMPFDLISSFTLVASSKSSLTCSTAPAGRSYKSLLLTPYTFLKRGSSCRRLSRCTLLMPVAPVQRATKFSFDAFEAVPFVFDIVSIFTSSCKIVAFGIKQACEICTTSSSGKLKRQAASRCPAVNCLFSLLC